MYQNAKQEAFWAPVEGRLMAMLEGVPDLTLSALNEATQRIASSVNVTEGGSSNCRSFGNRDG